MEYKRFNLFILWNMKIIAIWDIHWRTTWKDIVLKNNFDIVVFIWDYFDTYEDISIDQQVKNFHDILEFKKNNRDKVIMLLWNHDYQYLDFVDEVYSWFNPVTKLQVSKVLTESLEWWLIQMAYQYWKLLFTHAWVSLSWYTSLIWREYSQLNDNEIWEIADHINNIVGVWWMQAFSFYRWDKSYTWDNKDQSPIWIRPKALCSDMIEWITYVSWHTEQKDIMVIKHEVMDSKLILIDCLWNWKFFEADIDWDNINYGE